MADYAGMDETTLAASAEAAFPLSGRFPAPVFVVTACADGRRAGCVVGFATEVSIHPARFLACISRQNATFPVAMRASRLAVHSLTEQEHGIARLFGGETGDEVDKFSLCEWIPAADGTPILTACPTWFIGRILERIDLGDHVGCLLGPERWRDGGEIAQLTTRDLSDITPGHPA
jgi:flavin reductase (DIM6/NTAB) family NADH-FMN oxidoreductase RutF